MTKLISLVFSISPQLSPGTIVYLRATCHDLIATPATPRLYHYPKEHCLCLPYNWKTCLLPLSPRHSSRPVSWEGALKKKWNDSTVLYWTICCTLDSFHRPYGLSSGQPYQELDCSLHLYLESQKYESRREASRTIPDSRAWSWWFEIIQAQFIEGDLSARNFGLSKELYNEVCNSQLHLSFLFILKCDNPKWLLLFIVKLVIQHILQNLKKKAQRPDLTLGYL